MNKAESKTYNYDISMSGESDGHRREIQISSRGLGNNPFITGDGSCLGLFQAGDRDIVSGDMEIYYYEFFLDYIRFDSFVVRVLYSEYRDSFKLDFEIVNVVETDDDKRVILHGEEYVYHSMKIDRTGEDCTLYEIDMVQSSVLMRNRTNMLTSRRTADHVLWKIDFRDINRILEMYRDYTKMFLIEDHWMPLLYIVNILGAIRKNYSNNGVSCKTGEHFLKEFSSMTYHKRYI